MRRQAREFEGIRWFGRRFCRRKWFLATALLFFVIHSFAPSLYGQTPAPQNGAQTANGEMAGVEELARLLVEKGLLKREDLAALMQKKGESGLSGLAALTELLKMKGVLTSEEAVKVRKKAETTPRKAVVLFAERDQKEIEKMTQNVTSEIKKDVREKVKAEIKKEVLKETKDQIKSVAAPEWTKRIRFGGDVRLRYQGDSFDARNASIPDPNASNYPNTLLNTGTDRQRFRVRARLEATADIDENLEAGARLVTGSTTNPVSTNQTMGTYMNNYSVAFDRVYLKYKPFPSLTFLGGRFANPFFHSSLVWGPDVAFDGFAAEYRPKLTKWLDAFAVAGAFPLQEIDLSSKDKWLYGGQLGFEVKPRKQLSWKFGTAYYLYKNTQGIPNDPARPNVFDYTAPQFVQKGNTMFDIDPSSSYKLALASEYRELNLTSTFDIGFWDPIHVVILGDYVRNIGFNKSDVARVTGTPNVQQSIKGYQFGLSVGHHTMLKRGDWKVYGYYRYLESDAVLDAFTDPDFHLGGTNARGWILGAELGLGKNIWISTKYTTANEIEGLPLSIDSLFMDLNVRF